MNCFVFKRNNFGKLNATDIQMNRPKWSAVHTNTQIRTKTKFNLDQ